VDALRPPRRRLCLIAPCIAIVVSSARPAHAGEEAPSRREHTLCAELRDANRLAEAVPHCRAAYDALPDDTSEPTLNARSLIVFDSYHTYLEAFEATGDHAFLCGGEKLMSDFSAYLDERQLSEERSIDHEDAQRLQAQLASLRGERPCGEPALEDADDELLPVLATTPPPAAPAAPEPQAPRGLRIAGGVTLGAGVGLGLLTAGALVVGARMESERDRLTSATAEVDIGPEGYILADRLDRLGTRANRVALGSAIGAGAAIITSIVLFTVDGHRRRVQRLSLAPAPGGGQLSIRF
jgi:hypothetical protein